MLLAPLVSWQAYVVIVLLGALVIWMLYASRKVVRGPKVVNRITVTLLEPRRVLLFLVGVAIYAVLAVAALSGVILLVHAIKVLVFVLDLSKEEPSLWQAFLDAGRAVVLGLLSVILTLPLLLATVRYNELRDSSQDAPQITAREASAQFLNCRPWLAPS